MTARIPLALLAAILAAAALLRLSFPADTDVSWLLTVGEKALGGARVYADIVETNPPASFLVYMPAILLARLFHAAPETLVAVLVFLGTGASLLLCRAILDGGLRRDILLCFAAALLLILPAAAFAQRDHIALIAMLPLLALCAARAARANAVALPWALLAGIGGGIALAIKPHYLLALAPALAFAMRRGAAAFVPELLAAAAVCLAYGALILVAFPAYLHTTLPLVLAVYRPVAKAGWTWANPSLVIAAMLAAGLAALRPRGAAVAVPALAGLGAVLAVIVQAKGWPYHGYPAMALLALALAVALDTAWEARARGARPAAAAILLALALAGSFLWLSTRRDTTLLTERVAAVAPPHPGIIAISPDIALGHPLTRRLGGDWRGTNWGEWVSQDTARLLGQPGLTPARRARLQAYAAADRAVLARDIARNRPDIVLVEKGWHGWTFADPAIAAAMKPYRLAAAVEGVEIWRR